MNNWGAQLLPKSALVDRAKKLSQEYASFVTVRNKERTGTLRECRSIIFALVSSVVACHTCIVDVLISLPIILSHFGMQRRRLIPFCLVSPAGRVAMACIVRCSKSALQALHLNTGLPKELLFLSLLALLQLKSLESTPMRDILRCMEFYGCIRTLLLAVPQRTMRYYNRCALDKDVVQRSHDAAALGNVDETRLPSGSTKRKVDKLQRCGSSPRRAQSNSPSQGSLMSERKDLDSIRASEETRSVLKVQQMSEEQRWELLKIVYVERNPQLGWRMITDRVS